MTEQEKSFNVLLKKYFGDLQIVCDNYGSNGKKENLNIFKQNFEPSIEGLKKIPRGEMRDRFSLYQSHYLFQILLSANKFNHLDEAEKIVDDYMYVPSHENYKNDLNTCRQAIKLKATVLKKDTIDEKTFYEDLQIIKAQIHSIPMIHGKEILDLKYMLASFCYFSMGNMEECDYWLKKGIEQGPLLIMKAIVDQFDPLSYNDDFAKFIDHVERVVAPYAAPLLKHLETPTRKLKN